MAEYDFVGVAELAAAMGVDERTVRRRIRDGVIDAVRVNPRLWLVPRVELERLRGQGKLRPGPKPRERAPDG